MALPAAKISSHKCLTKLQRKGKPSPTLFHTNVSLSSMQQSGHHFQPLPPKQQETNFHPNNISEFQFKSVSSHKCLTNSKLDWSAHTNVSLSSKGRESHPHLVSRKCLTKSLSSMQRSGHHHIEAQDRRDGKQSSDSQTHP